MVRNQWVGGSTPLKVQLDLHATSFVIASPEARSVIERTFDADAFLLIPSRR
jgi:hypothetical protein